VNDGGTLGDRTSAEKTTARVVVIGVGNLYRRDDAAGLVVAQHLRQIAPSHVTVMEQEGEPTALLEAWKDAHAVVLIDAVSSGAEPGTIHRLDALAGAVPQELFRYSTHAVSVAEAIELARALGQLPPKLVVYGIEGKDFSAGVGLSPEVESRVAELSERVLRELPDASETGT
jgi:hydrogenase maturation protease